MPQGKTGKNGNARRKGPWSHAEIEKLKRAYGLKSDPQVARDLQRSVESVRRMAKRVFGQGETRTGPWSAAEMQALKNYIGAASLETISLVLRRNPADVERKLRELQHQRSSGPWTSQDLQTLKRLYGTRSDGDLSVILGRSAQEIERMAEDLCLAKDKAFRYRSAAPGGNHTRMPRWSEAEVQRLRQIYPERPNLDIARELGRSQKSIVSKAHDLGLRKSETRLRDMGRENVRQRYGEGLEEEREAGASV